MAEDAGVNVFGVTDTSHTGPSYRPRGTPLSSANYRRTKRDRSQTTGQTWSHTTERPVTH